MSLSSQAFKPFDETLQSFRIAATFTFDVPNASAAPHALALALDCPNLWKYRAPTDVRWDDVMMACGQCRCRQDASSSAVRPWVLQVVCAFEEFHISASGRISREPVRQRVPMSPRLVFLCCCHHQVQLASAFRDSLPSRSPLLSSATP